MINKLLFFLACSFALGLLAICPPQAEADKLMHPDMINLVPMYPGAESLGYGVTDKLTMLRLDHVPADKVSKWYIEQMTKRGWEVTMKILGELNGKLAFSKPGTGQILLMDIDHVPPDWTYIKIRLMQ